MNSKQLFFISVFVVLISGSCAKMGSLTGGPKDEDPPRVVESKPVNYSINFSGKRIEITFDEFIILNSVNQELVVSPPLEEKPLVRIRNKSILIDLNNELRDSTTYTLNFGQAIKDNNEGNLLNNYEFVFSTGDYLDSLSVGGTLLNAFDLTPPEEPVSIMLYRDLNDSVVFREIPVYIGKTDDEGNFRINNLREGRYKLFALKDVNNNFLFDLPNEQVAFADSTLNVDPEFFLEVIKEQLQKALADSTSTDTIVRDTSVVTVVDDTGILEISPEDSLLIKPDSIVEDTLFRIPDQLLIDLLLFTEESNNQYLDNSRRNVRNMLEFSFNRPVTDSFFVNYLVPDRDDCYLIEESAGRDTFTYWILDEQVRLMDSILFELNYTVLDSTDSPVWKSDSIFFVYREPARSVRKKEGEEEVSMISLSGPRRNAVLEINTRLNFTSGTPVNNIDTSRVTFVKIVDSLLVPEPFRFEKDSVYLRKLNFKKEWEPRAKYELTLYPGAVMDVFGATNDTLDYKFSIRPEDYYGVLIVNMDSLKTPTIIQLLDMKGNLKREHYMEKPGIYRFEYLKADKYRLKFILDENGNRKWDTGKYILKRQPEKVEFYQGNIEIRSNWDLEVKYR